MEFSVEHIIIVILVLLIIYLINVNFCKIEFFESSPSIEHEINVLLDTSPHILISEHKNIDGINKLFEPLIDYLVSMPNSEYKNAKTTNIWRLTSMDKKWKELATMLLNSGVETREGIEQNLGLSNKIKNKMNDIDKYRFPERYVQYDWENSYKRCVNQYNNVSNKYNNYLLDNMKKINIPFKKIVLNTKDWKTEYYNCRLDYETKVYNLYNGKMYIKKQNNSGTKKTIEKIEIPVVPDVIKINL